MRKKLLTNYKTRKAIPLTMITTIFLFSLSFVSCASTIKTETLDYYKVALLSVDEAVKAGAKHAVETLPASCYKSDTCVANNLDRWFAAVYSVQIASKFLQAAYTAPKDPEGIRAIACSVAHLRDVHTILLQHNISLPDDYKSFFIFLDTQAKGMLCGKQVDTQEGGEA